MCLCYEKNSQGITLVCWSELKTREDGDVEVRNKRGEIIEIFILLKLMLQDEG